MSKKFNKDCTGTAFVDCHARCATCGWNEEVANERLHKRFTDEQIEKLKSIRFRPFESDHKPWTPD